MANINENLLVKGARGNVGKQFVYRKHGNDTNIVKMPSFNKDLAPTEAQSEIRELFASASLYAQGATSSPELKQQYKKKAGPGRTAFNIAFRDFLKAPVVKNIDVENYNGTVGSTVVVKALDDFKIAGVNVSIRDAGGVLLEEGVAIPNPLNRLLYTYTAVQNNGAPAGSVISATATDLAGNRTRLDLTV